MVRILLGCFAILLIFNDLAAAQSPKRSLAERWNAMFSRPEKPAPAPRRLPQSADASPVRVTTRSGSLRRPGPEPPTQTIMPSTPTYVQMGKSRQAGLPKKTPGTQGRDSVRSTRFQDRALAPAGLETPPRKTTMVDWLRGIWPVKKASEPRAKTESRSIKVREPKRTAQVSTSVDPRRVYRGPSDGKSNGQPMGAGSYSFNETGVPSTGTQFRGRRDTAN